MNGEQGVISRWPAMPAAIAILLGLALTGYVFLAGGEPDVVALKAKAEAAGEAQAHSAAVLHYRHLLALQPNEPSHAVELALSLDRLKRRSEAMAVLSTVAPATGIGYAPAHLRLAEWAIESRVMGGQLNAEAIEAALHHAQAAKADPGSRLQAETLVDILNGMRTP